MATRVVPPTKPAPPSDITTDIRNTLDARERMHALRVVLVQKRKYALTTFLRTFAENIVAAGNDTEEQFVEGQFVKFRAWKAADDEMASRIDAFTSIATCLDNRIRELEQ